MIVLLSSLSLLVRRPHPHSRMRVEVFVALGMLFGACVHEGRGDVGGADAERDDPSADAAPVDEVATVPTATMVTPSSAAPPRIGAVASGAAGSGLPSSPTIPSVADASVVAAGPCSERVVSAVEPCSDEPDPCGLQSGWEGDEYCLKPPPIGKGIQIHFGPRDYGDKAETDEYVIDRDQEFNNSALALVPLDSDRYFDRITVQMRPGIHRWMSQQVPGRSREEGFYADTTCEQGLSSEVGGLGGGKNLIYDNPPQGVPAPENAGIGWALAGNSSLCLNLHAYNFTDEQQLREVWINLYFTDASRVTQPTGAISMVGGLGLRLPPGERKTSMHEATFEESGRIIQLFSDRHMWTSRFAVWLNDRLVYDSRDWEAQVRFNYDSITVNPPIDPAGVRDGAVSGILPFEAGDVLKYSCVIDNESDQTLVFLNELRSGEQCNLWGTTVGGGLRTQFQ